MTIKFNDIISAYKEVNKSRLEKTVNWLSLMNKSSSVSWVYIEVAIDPESENPEKVDIIQFYNRIFLNKMKVYILQSKKLPKDQSSKTPILNKSNFELLMTPGG